MENNMKRCALLLLLLFSTTLFAQDYKDKIECKGEMTPSFGLNLGHTSNDQIGSANYGGVILGYRDPCHLITGPFFEAQQGSEGDASAVGLTVKSYLNFKVSHFTPDYNSSLSKSTRYSIGFHFVLFGFDVGYKTEDNSSRKIPSLGFNIGL
jgi:hypothetical protein